MSEEIKDFVLTLVAVFVGVLIVDLVKQHFPSL